MLGKTSLCRPDMLVCRPVIRCGACWEMKPGDPRIGWRVDRKCVPVFLGAWLWKVGAVLLS